MSTNTSQHHPFLQRIHIVFLLSILMAVSHGQQDSVPSLNCLLDQQITTSCIDGLDVQYWVKQQPQYLSVMCPAMVSLVEKAGVQNATELLDKLLAKAESICQTATQIDPDNGYLLFIIHIIRRSYSLALALEYQLFFNGPFLHERKFTQALQKCTQYLRSQITLDSNMTQHKLLDSTIKSFYLGKLGQSLQNLQTLINDSSLGISQVKQHLKFLHIRILEKNGQFPDALTRLDQYITNANGNCHWYMYHLKGNLLMHHLKFKEAIHQFEQAIRLKGDMRFGFSLYNIGLCYQKMGKYRQSIEYLKKIPTPYAEVFNSIGFGYYSLISPDRSDKQNKKNAQQAENYFAKAINADNNYYLAYFNFGVLKYDLGQYPQAVQYFQNAIQVNSNSSSISLKYALFKALHKTNKQKAMEYLSSELATSKGFTPGDFAAILHEVGENKEALRYLNKALELKSNLGQVYERKGMVQFEIGQASEAMESFRKALQNGNTKPAVWFNLAYLEEQAGNYSKALYLYEKAFEIDPEGPAKDKIDEVKLKAKSENDKDRRSGESEL